MAKNQDKTTNNLIQQQARTQQAEHTEDRNLVNSRSNDAYNRQGQMYDAMFGGLNNFIQTGGVSQEDKDRMRGLMGADPRGGGGGGGYYGGTPIDVNALGLNELEALYRDSITGKSVDTNRLRAGIPTLTELSQSGGYSPEFLAGLGGDIASLRGIAATGGVDPEAMQRMRGNGMYDYFAATGGIDGNQEAAIRQRASSGVNAAVDRGKANISRQARLTGNTGATAALMGKATRDAASEARSAGLDAELGIADRRIQGQQYGTTGMVNAENSLQSLISGNRMNALSRSMAGESGIQEYISNMRRNAANDIGANERPIQEMLLGERQYGIGGLETIIQKRIEEQQRQQAMAAAAASAAAADAEGSWRDRLGLEQYLMETGINGRQYGLEGMMGLYGTTPAESAMYNDMRLGERDLTGSQANANIGRARDNRAVGFGEAFGNQLGQIAQAGVGAAVGAFMPTAGVRRPGATNGRVGTGSVY